VVGIIDFIRTFTLDKRFESWVRRKRLAKLLSFARLGLSRPSCLLICRLT